MNAIDEKRSSAENHEQQAGRGRKTKSNRGRGVNKTLYLGAEDADAWRKAKKYLNFYEDKGLSEYLSEQLHKVVEKYEGKS